MKTHLLFVCSSNLDRSPAAESLFEGSKRYEAKSCGILPHSERVISKEAVLWADKIICMEHIHKAYIMQNFPESLKKEMIVLNIPNNLARNDPRLIALLKEKLKKDLEFQLED